MPVPTWAARANALLRPPCPPSSLRLRTCSTFPCPPRESPRARSGTGGSGHASRTREFRTCAHQPTAAAAGEGHGKTSAVLDTTRSPCPPRGFGGEFGCVSWPRRSRATARGVGQSLRDKSLGVEGISPSRNEADRSERTLAKDCPCAPEEQDGVSMGDSPPRTGPSYARQRMRWTRPVRLSYVPQHHHTGRTQRAKTPPHRPSRYGHHPRLQERLHHVVVVQVGQVSLPRGVDDPDRVVAEAFLEGVEHALFPHD